ncbi:hypothetical protein [Novosphingobium sp.]|uniref:hypothetical protein n=1 Tax=Novosphingobium sp. TaxID=1874826 RepID=UPI0035B2B44D
MAIEKWIGIAEAVEDLINSRMATLVDDHTLESYAYAYDILVGALADGSLPSKPLNIDEYSLEFSSDVEVQSIPLGNDGTIPLVFWHHFKSVRASVPGLPVDKVNEEYVELLPFTSFRQTRLKDNGVLTGEAGEVMVLRAQIPGSLPKRRGERGPSKYAEKDRQIAQEAARLIMAGEPQSNVVKRLALQMDGASENAKESRLRGLLKGHPEMKKK